MSEGRMEQVGTPFEIYNFPATPFVASFVGTLNAVQATLVDAAAGRLSLAGHEIRTTTAVSGAPGTDVLVALRPEMVALADGGVVPDGYNRVPATVSDVAFLGSVVRVTTTVGPDTRVDVDTFNNPNLAVPAAGTPVQLDFPPEAALVLGQGTVSQSTDVLAAAEALL
jgi:putative spermidine/putrescine transport system ATP-binding protein